jgi:hypothetical protein
MTSLTLLGGGVMLLRFVLSKTWGLYASFRSYLTRMKEGNSSLRKVK